MSTVDKDDFISAVAESLEKILKSETMKEVDVEKILESIVKEIESNMNDKNQIEMSDGLAIVKKYMPKSSLSNISEVASRVQTSIKSSFPNLEKSSDEGRSLNVNNRELHFMRLPNNEKTAAEKLYDKNKPPKSKI